MGPWTPCTAAYPVARRTVSPILTSLHSERQRSKPAETHTETRLCFRSTDAMHPVLRGPRPGARLEELSLNSSRRRTSVPTFQGDSFPPFPAFASCLSFSPASRQLSGASSGKEFEGFPGNRQRCDALTTDTWISPSTTNSHLYVMSVAAPKATNPDHFQSLQQVSKSRPRIPVRGLEKPPMMGPEGVDNAVLCAVPLPKLGVDPVLP